MSEHLLKTLSLPDRYERLATALGAEVANLLVAPPSVSIDQVRLLANEVLTRDEGVLVPLFGRTGTGKTTFAMNMTQWQPTLFAPALQYDGALEFEPLVHSMKQFTKSLPADNRRIVPLNIDHRENAPPSDQELSTLKRFLRTNAAGVPSVVFWPETSREIANEVAQRYVNIAGRASVDLPLVYEGPPRDSWQDIARHTMSLVNRINDLEGLGVDPADYDPAGFHSLGDFLRQISHDFNAKVQALRQDLEKPVSVVIAFASESSDPGVLAQLTSASRYGLLDGHALVSVTSQSEIGKWWSGRRGLLTRTIVQLNAMAVCLSPTAASSSIRNFADDVPAFETLGYKRYGPARGIRDLKRSDLGKVLTRAEVTRFEARGTPAEDATAAFKALADAGFNLGKDKALNRVMLTAIEALLRDSEIPFVSVSSEEKLPFCGLIPDNAIYFNDVVQCVEYTWRKGDFLATGNRSTTAQYILTKLQKYARQLGWTSD